jgi:hypothetical protein
MRGDAEVLTGRLSLGGLAALLERAAVHVGNDSGPLHVAGAAGCRTVGIYWGPNIVNAGPPGRALHRPAIAWDVCCPVCGLPALGERCEHDVSFVAGVGVEEVAASALALLEEAASAPRLAPSAP